MVLRLTANKFVNLKPKSLATQAGLGLIFAGYKFAGYKYVIGSAEFGENC